MDHSCDSMGLSLLVHLPYQPVVIVLFPLGHNSEILVYLELRPIDQGCFLQQLLNVFFNLTRPLHLQDFHQSHKSVEMGPVLDWVELPRIHKVHAVSVFGDFFIGLLA